MKWIFKIALFVLCYCAAERFCKTQLGSFTVHRISSNLTYHPEWEIAPLPPAELASIKKMLQQSYSYFSKGSQSFVFASQDGQYVIKFFRHDHLSAPFFYDKLPFEWAQRRVAKKTKRLNYDFGSYKLAYENLKKETGLVFLHLNKTSDLGQTLDLVDKLGIHHQIPLDDYTFLLQRRASKFYPTLNQMIQENCIDEAKKTLTNLTHLLALRAQKGLYAKDPNLESNFGIIGTDPIQIDVGRFRKKPHKKGILCSIRPLRESLEESCPELSRHLKTEIEKALGI